MNNLAYNSFITKENFVKKLIAEFGEDNLYANSYKENGRKLFLVYKINPVENGDPDLHIATWQNGKGWIFAHAYNK